MLEKLTDGILCESAEQTASVACAIAREMKSGTIALLGDLGAGKTTFAKGLARGLGVMGNVKSPSFSVCMTYEGELANFVHIDAYRLRSPDDFDSLLIDEIVSDPKLICVEWPQIVAAALEYDTLWLEILPCKESENSRLIKRTQPNFKKTD